jgi:hypothetical protein
MKEGMKNYLQAAKEILVISIAQDVNDTSRGIVNNHTVKSSLQ